MSQPARVLNIKPFLLRGLVATSSIPETSRPLVAIPEPLVLTPAAALFSLGRSGVLCEDGLESLSSYAAASGDLAAPISLVLAADALRIARPGGEGGETTGSEGGGWRISPWGAYTASLSPPPLEGSEVEEEKEEGRASSGCAGWFLPPEAREAALVRSFPSGRRRKQISRALDEALRVEREAAEATVAAAFLGGEKDRGEVFTARLLTWARSQIVSRAFAAPSSSGNDGEGRIVPALLPVLDLCNHSPRGGFPAWGVVSSSSSSSSAAAAASASSSSAAAGSDAPSSSPPPPPPPQQQQPRLCWLRNASPLSEGEELTTDYSRLCGGDGGAWMANYGFVPAEAK